MFKKRTKIIDKERDDAASRTLTVTPITPKAKIFTHTPIGEELFAELEARLGLVIVAGCLVKNGTSPYEILNLYFDKQKSDPRWEERMSWIHDEQHHQIRNILFEVFEKHGLKPPIEKAYDKQTGELISDTCFNISLIDFAYWQEYWKRGDDR